MKISKSVFILLIVFSVSGIVMGVYNYINTPKIGFVRSAELVYGYYGMQDAHNRLKSKTDVWQANVDTLKADLQRTYTVYREQQDDLSEADIKAMETRLKFQEQNLYKYTNSVEQKKQEEDEKVTQSVLNQINSFAEEYACEHGYDIILGTTQSGNVLFGIDGIDVTEDMLEKLNKAYKGEQSM